MEEMLRAADSRVSGMVAASRQRKQASREKLLAAGLMLMQTRGYVGLSVEEIATVAGVNRLTFYRHFATKADLAIELYRQLTVEDMPRFLSIRDAAVLDRAAVQDWIAAIFAADRRQGQLHRVFALVFAHDATVAEQARQTINDLIAGLGECIPAFTIDSSVAADQRHQLEAWLLLFQILYQGHHAALDSGIARDPLVVEILADQFLAFVAKFG